MRVALVHDWLTGMRGGEKVLSQICRLVPRADLFTMVYAPGACDARIERRRIVASCLNDLPGARRYYRWLLPLMPLAAERLDASGYELVISSSHCVAKGIIVAPESAHVCYCHTPMRYVWEQAEEYSRRQGVAGWLLRGLRGYLRAWDVRSAGHVDGFIANSLNVAGRIDRAYGRTAAVVYPPIDTDFFTPADVAREDFYLVVSALAPYKRVEQAVAACARLGRRLKIIGSGQQTRLLRRDLPGGVELLGWQGDEVVRDHYRRCRALLFPGEEDFGMVPVEAMACGAPVVAFGRGGALETVLDPEGGNSLGPTGILYEPGTGDALAEAVLRLERLEALFQPRRLAAWAGRFGAARFLDQFKRAVVPYLREKGLSEPWSNDTAR